MKDVVDMMQKKERGPYDYQELVLEIINDKDVAHFIAQYQLSREEIDKSISKFNQFISERDRFLAGEADYLSKGYQPVLIMNQGYADVSYKETEELLQAERAQELRERVQLVNLPESLRGVSLQDVEPDDRWEVIQVLTRYLMNYPNQEQAYYIYGDFGIGKTYLLAALANDLSLIKEVHTTLLHFPSFVLDVRAGISNNTVRDQVDHIKKVPLLILDDIGAEQFSAWVRDEVLQVILQYRMQENLPTFFSSNLSFSDLQKKMSRGKDGDETWQAQRVMERIRYLAKEVHLPGQNRRNK